MIYGNSVIKKYKQDFERSRSFDLERQESKRQQNLKRDIEIFRECVQQRIDTSVEPHGMCTYYDYTSDLNLDSDTALKCLKEKLSTNGFSDDEKFFEFKCFSGLICTVNQNKTRNKPKQQQL